MLPLTLNPLPPRHDWRRLRPRHNLIGSSPRYGSVGLGSPQGERRIPSPFKGEGLGLGVSQAG